MDVKEVMQHFDAQTSRIREAHTQVAVALEQNEISPCLPPDMLDALKEADSILEACAGAMLRTSDTVKRKIKENPDGLMDMAIDSIVDCATNGTDRDFNEMMKILQK